MHQVACPKCSCDVLNRLVYRKQREPVVVEDKVIGYRLWTPAPDLTCANCGYIWSEEK